MQNSVNNPILFRFRRILITVLLLVLTGILIFYLLEYPRFIELDIQSPISYLPNGDWDHTAYTTLVTKESYQRYFIWRRDGRAYGKSNSFTFNSEANVLGFFEEKLKSRGWYRAGDMLDTYKCPMIFPDLEPSLEPNVVVEQFNKLGEDPFEAWEFVCILIRRIPLENDAMFYVVLASSRASPWTWFVNAWD